MVAAFPERRAPRTALANTSNNRLHLLVQKSLEFYALPLGVEAFIDGQSLPVRLGSKSGWRWFV